MFSNFDQIKSHFFHFRCSRTKCFLKRMNFCVWSRFVMESVRKTFHTLVPITPQKTEYIVEKMKAIHQNIRRYSYFASINCGIYFYTADVRFPLNPFHCFQWLIVIETISISWDNRYFFFFWKHSCETCCWCKCYLIEQINFS